MGNIIKNSNGSFTISGGFSTSNPKDMEMLRELVLPGITKVEEKTIVVEANPNEEVKPQLETEPLIDKEVSIKEVSPKVSSKKKSKKEKDSLLDKIKERVFE